MTYEEFIELVRSLRAHQKAFFRDRRAEDLKECKRLEREVDRQLQKGPAQADLFDKT